jgi:hypothetical protein
MDAKRIILSILIIAMLTFQNCDPHIPRKMLINDSKEVTINFGDNKIIISATNWGGWILNYDLSIFYLYMKYYLKDEITIHRDVIHIEYEGNPIEWNQVSNYDSDRKKTFPPNISSDSLMKIIEKRLIRDPDYKLSGNGHLSLPFSLRDDIKVKKGDKIKITAPGFITYNGDTLSLGELTLEIGQFYR